MLVGVAAHACQRGQRRMHASEGGNACMPVREAKHSCW
jgi:hypothetical protein